MDGTEYQKCLLIFSFQDKLSTILVLKSCQHKFLMGLKFGQVGGLDAKFQNHPV